MNMTRNFPRICVQESTQSRTLSFKICHSRPSRAKPTIASHPKQVNPSRTQASQPKPIPNRMKRSNNEKSLTSQINRFDCLPVIFYICLLIAIKNWMIIHAKFFFSSLSPLNSNEWANEEEEEGENEANKKNEIIIIRLCIFIIPHYRIVNMCIFVVRFSLSIFRFTRIYPDFTR